MPRISDFENKEQFCSIITNELKLLGVKFRKEKKHKHFEDRKYHNQIFGAYLHKLELTDVILANGSVVQIPAFLADACNRILEQVDMEGIFRKTGSSVRQKEIRVSLESGIPLGRVNHVIDVANIVKFFFRELPEPLIASAIQDTLLRCLQIERSNMKKTILLACLLLPSLTLNTLSFFMQFLKTVALSAHQNRMSIENLAIIFTPALMPFSDIKNQRFNQHVRVVQLLIENANLIGIVPDDVVDKMNEYHIQLNMEQEDLETRQKRKKNRRSDMFNGFKKIVGSAIGSSEHLESTPDNKRTSTAHKLNMLQSQQPPSTPHLLKSSKKRKFTEPTSTFSAKKKKDLLAPLPSNGCGLLPNALLTKPIKKSRLSLGGNRIKNTVSSSNPIVASMERRWSIVGAGWTKRNKADDPKVSSTSDDSFLDIDIPDSKNTVPSPKLLNAHSAVNAEYMHTRTYEQHRDNCAGTSDGERFIAENEYEEIKARMKAIEASLSQEFNNVHHPMLGNTPVDDSFMQIMNGPERVQNKFEEMIFETEGLNSPSTDQLAQRLSRGLKIRRSVDRPIRSPSARKIGTLRRRSQERKRLSRTLTWHVSTVRPASSNVDRTTPPIQPELSDCSSVGSPFPNKINLKRGRPNSIQSGLVVHNALPPFIPLQVETNSVLMDITAPDDNAAIDDDWISGELFFNNITERGTYSNTRCFTGSSDDTFTPVRCKSNQRKENNDNMFTPMCPPRSILRKGYDTKTPGTAAIKPTCVGKQRVGGTGRVCPLTPLLDEANGRASIARLRSQNAGMVMAKAKLFDGLGGGNSPKVKRIKDLRAKPDAISLVYRGPSDHRGNGGELTMSNTFDSWLPPKASEDSQSTIRLEARKPTIDIESLNPNRKKINCKSPGSVGKRQRYIIPTKPPPKNL